MSAPAVSVITPTYNRRYLLEETIDSILGQNFRQFELVIVDDGSDDGTAEMLRACSDERIRVLKQANQGEVSAINHGWQVATGRYIAIVSSDDPMQPNWLSELVAALDSDPQAVVAYPDWAIVDEDGCIEQIIRTPQFDLHQMVATFTAPVGPGALIRKSIADHLAPPRRPEFRCCADLDMWLRLALHGHFVRVPKVLATWRRHAGSITVSERTAQRADELINLAHQFFKQGGLPFEISLLGNRAVASAYEAAAWVVKETDPDRSAAYSSRAQFFFPRSSPAPTLPASQRQTLAHAGN